MDVKRQISFLFNLASPTNSKPETPNLKKIASQLKVTYYDCGEKTENKINALIQFSKCNIAAENLEVRKAKITMYTKQFRLEIKATV